MKLSFRNPMVLAASGLLLAVTFANAWDGQSQAFQPGSLIFRLCSLAFSESAPQAGGTQAGAAQAGGTQAGAAQAGGTQAGGSTLGGGGGDARGWNTSNEAKDLTRFGDAFFSASRAAIIASRQKPANDAEGTSAFNGPVGPFPLGNVFGTPPETYQLGPGDKLIIRVATRVQEPDESKVTVDTLGSIVVPKSGRRLTLRGQTLSQAEAQITRELSRILREPTVTVTLNELRTFTVTVLGESFAPGAYQVPATFSLFNLVLATGGPSPRGTLRSIQLRRSNTPTKHFDLYQFFITGDAMQDMHLQPGDVVFYGVVQGEASVFGEVNRPGVFELTGSDDLSKLLTYAGGIRASGFSQNVSVDSVVPGSERRLLNLDLSRMSEVGRTAVHDGDKIQVFSIRPVIRNAVTINGPVEQPRTYAFREGMSVRDLVKQALGLRAEADPNIAEVRRMLPDGSQTLIRVDLAGAMRGELAANLLLRPDDVLRVFDVNDIAWTGERRVTISGAVRDPGDKVRLDGMRVGDLIRESRGLQASAYSQEAHLQRFNKDGSPAELIRVNLSKVVLGDPDHDVLLQDRDRLRVYMVSEWQASPELTASITGSVQRPGDYPLARGLKVKDLLDQAGGPTLDAFRPRAYLQKINTDGTVGPIVTIDIEKALGGDPEHNLVLHPRDRLNVQSIAQSQFQVQQVVTIHGGVQRPGEYPASSNLTLKDLIALAGGLLPDASGMVEISRAWRAVGEGVSSVQIRGELDSWDIPEVPIQSGSIISVFQRSDVLARPRIVSILGAVERPGAYVITKSNERISDIIKRAGGISSEGYARASEFIRNPDLLITSQQRGLTPKVLETLQTVAAAEFKRAQAILDLDRLKLVFSRGATITGSGNVPQVVGNGQELRPGDSMDRALAAALSAPGVTAARALNEKDLLPVGNLNARVDLAINRPGGNHDILVMDGDVILVPLRPTTITVVGAVLSPSSVLYQPGANLEYYIYRAGGHGSDADKDMILVIRATGEIIRWRRGVKLEAGDIVLTPTKTQGVRFREEANNIQSIASGVTTAASSLAILRALTRF